MASETDGYSHTRDYSENSDEEQNEDFIDNPDVEVDLAGGGEANDDAEEGEPGNNDGEGESQSAQKKPAKKRVVLNPRPKLDAERLKSSKGLPILPTLFDNKKFRGKGYEKEDLDQLMAMLEHWGHRLFPVMTFDTLLAAIEKLGAKKPVQVCIKKMRMDLPLLDNDYVTQRDDEDEETSVLNREGEDPDFPDRNTAFDELLRSYNPAENVARSDGTDAFSSAETQRNMEPTGKQNTSITDEMRERMERNKRLAIEKRRMRQLQQESLDASSSTGGTKVDPLVSGTDSVTTEMDESRNNLPDSSNSRMDFSSDPHSPNAAELESPKENSMHNVSHTRSLEEESCEKVVDSVLPDDDMLGREKLLLADDPAGAKSSEEANGAKSNSVITEQSDLLNEDEMLEQLWRDSI